MVWVCGKLRSSEKMSKVESSSVLFGSTNSPKPKQLIGRTDPTEPEIE